MRFKQFLEAVEPKVGDLVIKFDKDDNPYAGDIINVTSNNVKVKFKNGTDVFNKKNLRFTNVEKIGGKKRNHFQEK